jgi:hypothetical protein
MRLHAELLTSRVQDSPEKFRHRLIDHLIEQFPGWTIDDLVCSPESSIVFCNGIREGYAVDSLADALILSSLLNIRKRKDCPIGLKTKGPRRVLKHELINNGCTIEPAVFKKRLVDIMSERFTGRTIDDLVCRPREAARFCDLIRDCTHCRALPNQLILRTLMNVRKATGWTINAEGDSQQDAS